MGKKIYEFFIMSLLMVSIFYLGFSNKLKLLINPRYFIFIYIALIIIFLFVIISVLSSWEGKKKSEFKSCYILFLLMISLMFTTSYDNFQTSATDLKGITLPVITPEIVESSEEKPEILSQEVELDGVISINDENYYENIDRLYTDIDKYIGTKIEIKGFISKFNGLDSNHFVLSRMIMICCAADASVCGLICDTSNLEFDFKENMWYEITGYIEKQNVTIDSYASDNPVIRVEKFTPIEPLEDPYIYPNFL